MKSKSQSFFSFEGTARVDPAAIKKEEDDGKLRIFVEFEETGNEQVAARVTAKGEFLCVILPDGQVIVFFFDF